MFSGSAPQRVAEAPFTTRSYGDFYISVYEDAYKEHVALTLGEIKSTLDVPVRLQSECLPGTAFDSADCECADQLQKSFEIIATEGLGVILYMREEGRGLGLVTKVRAMNNKERGMDTFEAVRALGLPPDVRNYSTAAAILRDLGVSSVRLLTNNPDKISGLQMAGISVSGRIPVEIEATKKTRQHLEAKQRAGHIFTQNLGVH